MTKRGGTSDLVVIAAIAGAHGIRGNVRIRSFTGVPNDCFSYGPLLDEEGQVLLDPQHFHPSKNHFVVTPKKPKQKEEWDVLKGVLLHVEASILPETDDDEFYTRDLVGLSVFAGGAEAIGNVKAVHDFGAGDILEINLIAEPKSLMVPFTQEDVPIVDINNGRLVVSTLDLWSAEDREP